LKVACYLDPVVEVMKEEIQGQRRAKKGKEGQRRAKKGKRHEISF
jgi:hypothetical protein